MHLPSYHTRRAVLDLLYKSLNLQVNSETQLLNKLNLCQKYSFDKERGNNLLPSAQVHDWTDEFDVAIKAADPSAPRPAWRLGEGFTAAEGEKR